jgi:hypothetical protein
MSQTAMTEDCQTIIDFLGCDYELFENETDGAKICARREELWEQGRREGFTPLLILVSDVLVETIELDCEDAGLEVTAENAAKGVFLGARGFWPEPPENSSVFPFPC